MPAVKAPSGAYCVIGLDPGLASSGYGILKFLNNRYYYINCGVIKTDSKEVHSRRLLVIYNALLDVLEEYQPDEASMESLYFAKNVSSALPVAEARGVITLACAVKRVPVHEYSPNMIKKSVSGTARADKATVQNSVKFLLGLDKVPSPDHAADALAAAIAHLNCGIGAAALNRVSRI